MDPFRTKLSSLTDPYTSRPTPAYSPGMLANFLNQYIRGFSQSLMTPTPPLGSSFLTSPMPDLSNPLATSLINSPTTNTTGGWTELADEIAAATGKNGGGNGGGGGHDRNRSRTGGRDGGGGNGNFVDRATRDALGGLDLDDYIRRAQRQASRGGGGGGNNGGRSNANADGGSISLGNIDPGTNLDIDVSGGTARSNGRKKRRR